MFFLLNIFQFFHLTIQQPQIIVESTIQKPEICVQPHLLKNEKHTNESKNLKITHYNNVRNIEFIIDFKGDLILSHYAAFIELQEFRKLSLVSYDVIKQEKEDVNFEFICGFNYFSLQLKEDPTKVVFSLMSFNNFSKNSFYNYISKTKNKAWKVIITLNNKNNEFLCQLESSIFKLNYAKTELETFNDNVLTITKIPKNSLSEEELIKLDEIAISQIINN